MWYALTGLNFLRIITFIYVLVAQWIERLVAVQKVVGSTPTKNTLAKSKTLTYVRVLLL